MCQKRQRRCPVALQIREEALQEWAAAETLEAVRRAWARCGGRITLHRRAAAWFRVLALRRWEKASNRQCPDGQESESATRAICMTVMTFQPIGRCTNEEEKRVRGDGQRASAGAARREGDVQAG